MTGYTINELDCSKTGLEFQSSETTYASLGQALSTWHADESRHDVILGIFHSSMALNENPIIFLMRGAIFVSDDGNIRACDECGGNGSFFYNNPYDAYGIGECDCSNCHGSGYIDKANYDYIPPSQDLDDIPF